jgi:hypothetical protein
MAVDPYALTTLAKLQAYLGIPVSTDEALLEDAIDAASATIENVLGRKIMSREYWEWKDVNGRTKDLSVSNPPITRIECVAVGSQTAITVNGAPGANDIGLSIHVQEDKVYLCRLDSSGQKHQTSLSFGSNKTIAAMATAINATTGYTATNQFNGPVQLLHPTGGFNVFQTTAYLTAAWDVTLDTRIGYTGGMVSLISDSWPSDHWMQSFEQGRRNVLLHYVGGYETIPYDIEQVCLEAAGQMYRDRKRDRGVQSESLGDYSYSLGSATATLDLIRSRLGSRNRIR